MEEAAEAGGWVWCVDASSYISLNPNPPKNPSTHQNQLPVHLAQLARGQHHLIFPLPLPPILATPIPPILLHHGVVGGWEAARGGELFVLSC